MEQSLVLVPILLPLTGSAVALLLRRRRRIQAGWSLAIMLGSLASSGWLLARVWSSGEPVVLQVGGWPAPVGISLVGDLLSAMMVLMSQTVLSVGIVYALGSRDKVVRYPAFYPIFLTLAAGLTGALLTGDLFNLFVFAELLVFSGTILTAVSDDRLGVEAAFKYFLMSLLASAFLLLAIGSLYVSYGTLNMADLARRIAANPGEPLVPVAIGLLMATFLLKSGVPLVESMSALIDQLESPELKNALTQTRDKVNEGSSLADALKQHPRVFDHLFVNMVAAGEASGTLETVLSRLAEFLESQSKLKNKVTAALAYPFFMALMSMATVAIMMVVVVPKVTAIFDDFQQALPWYTRLLIFTSDVFTGYWWLLIAMVGGVVYGWRRWVTTTEGRSKWDRWLLGLPLFGKLFLMVAVSRFSRTLSTLLKSGVPILQAMEITKNVLGNVELQRVIFGICLIIVMAFLPGGIIELASRGRQLLRRTLGAARR